MASPTSACAGSDAAAVAAAGATAEDAAAFVIGAPCPRRAGSQYLYGIVRDATAIAATITSR